jgi:hypothetical protein
MKYVLLVKSLKSRKPAASDGDELSTEEKLLGILEERVRDAADDSRRRIAERELAEFRKVVRVRSASSPSLTRTVRR